MSQSKKQILSISLGFILSFIIKCQTTYQDTFNNGLTCKTGRIQSPIELSDESSIHSDGYSLTTVNYLSLNSLYLGFNERILKVSQNNVDSPNFGRVNYKKNGYLSQYQLIDIEFYYPAEHNIKVKGSVVVPEIEVKLIHKKNIKFFSSVNENRNFTEANSYLIVSLLYKNTATLSDNGFLSDFLTLYNPTKSPMMMKNIDLDKYNLIRSNRYYMYDGSFSYFPCDENVSYIVVKDLFFVSQTDINTIVSRYLTKYSSPYVNKAIAEPFGRPVFRNFVTLNSFIIQYKLLFTLIIILCLF